MLNRIGSGLGEEARQFQSSGNFICSYEKALAKKERENTLYKILRFDLSECNATG
jgi:hypothetical protein